MKKFKLIASLFFFLSFLVEINVDAQFGGLIQKVKNKVGQKAGEIIDNKPAVPKNSESKKSSKAVINTVFDFIQGDSVLVKEDFLSFSIGSSPNTIKTNGAGSVVNIQDQSGKWLALEGDATYRLNKQRFYPKHFTVEFDLLASADKISDMSPVTFGFTNDNSVKEYLQSAGEFVSLLYYNNNEIIIANNSGNHLSTNYDLTPYANRIMHVSLVVDGEKMIVYLDKTKMADTQLFSATDTKNFYISAPLNYNNGSKLLFSNLKIATFKADKSK